MRWIHPASSALVVVCTLVLISGLVRRGYRTLAITLAGNLAVQIVVGLLDVLLLAPLSIQVLHLFSADVFWISLVAVGTPIVLPHASSQAAALNQ